MSKNISPLVPYKEVSTQPGEIGAHYKQFGKVWHLAEDGGSGLSIGELAVSATHSTNFSGLSFAAAPAIGDVQAQVTLGATGLTAQDLENGQLDIISGTGVGISYTIGSHNTVVASATAVLTLKEPIVVAGAVSETNVDLVKNLYKDVQTSVTDQVDTPAGVSNIAVTASYFTMLQTWGPCAVLQDTTTGIGDTVVTGSSTTGAIEPANADAEPVVGLQGPVAGTDGGYEVVFLKLDPGI